MVTSKFTDILAQKQNIQQLETAELKSIIEEFPYFQSARALYLKGLKNQDSFKYNNELKVTAAHTLDRTILFDFITSTTFKDDKAENIHHQITKKILDEKPTLVFDKNTKQEVSIKETKKSLSIGKPIPFSSSEKYSFSEWLQLSSAKPIVRVEKKETSKTSIIDRFIEKNPKITPVEKDKKVSVLVSKNTASNSLMTETLAKVYLEQKKYENAIQAYKILSLKYPEKSGFFADQIKRIQILQKNKS